MSWIWRLEEGVSFFEAISSIRDKLSPYNKFGLSYIQIGQRATTLSGGEAQRVNIQRAFQAGNRRTLIS